MKTSRISKQTARVADTLSPATATDRPRRSLRAFQHQNYVFNSGVGDTASEESELSTPPSSPESVFLNAPGKRKRDTLVVERTNAIIKRSPRKAPKLEPDDGDKKPARKAKRQPAKRISRPDGGQQVSTPPNWEKMYNITAGMRKRILAPVDTMGCESLADKSRSPRDQRLQTLIALMLSSQTKDTVTAAAMQNLQDNLPGGFNLESLLAIEPAELNRLIEKVGFHNNKTKYIKATALILQSTFSGDIPDTIEGLVSLPGVGPKMAYLTMSAAWGRDEGIGVDVHVHRITNLWGWHKTSTPEQTRAELEAWLPKEKWHGINHLLVGFGQTICLPVGRKCGECDLASTGMCPSAVQGKPVKKVAKKAKVEVEPGAKKEEEEEAVVVKAEMDDVGIKVEAEVDGKDAVEVQSIAGAPLSSVDGSDSG